MARSVLGVEVKGNRVVMSASLPSGSAGTWKMRPAIAYELAAKLLVASQAAFVEDVRGRTERAKGIAAKLAADLVKDLPDAEAEGVC